MELWPPVFARDVSGGEGDRTPDLVNAIHALSQLSYAPQHHRSPCSGVRYKRFRREPRKLFVGIDQVKQMGLAQTSKADILQRFCRTKRARKQPSWFASSYAQRCDAPLRRRSIDDYFNV
jgi:hypothetical protein